MVQTTTEVTLVLRIDRKAFNVVLLILVSLNCYAVEFCLRRSFVFVSIFADLRYHCLPLLLPPRFEYLSEKLSDELSFGYRNTIIDNSKPFIKTFQLRNLNNFLLVFPRLTFKAFSLVRVEPLDFFE